MHNAGQFQASARDRRATVKAGPTGRYLSDFDLEIVLKLVVEVREQTHSQKSFDEATRIIALFTSNDHQLTSNDHQH
jgi:hypothetical protein